MKKQFLITIILLISINFTYSQILKPNSIIKTDHSSFITHGSNSRSMFVENKNNFYHTRKPKLPPTAISSVEKTDKYSLLKAFNQVFTNDRIKQLLPEHGLFIEFYVSPLGKVLEVRFLLPTNTMITAKELEQLEQAIKTNVTFALKQEETKGGDFFIIDQNARYDKILNKSLQ